MQRILLLAPFLLLLASAGSAGAAVTAEGDVCRPAPECRLECRAEAAEALAACLASGSPRAECKERSRDQRRACVAAKCTPNMECEARCRNHAAALRHRCLAAGGDVEDCRRDAIAAREACIETHCERCVCPQIYAPVCGEDGMTYGNACEADCAGVAVDHQGPCEPVCEPLACDLACPFGFAEDERGCDVCECAPPPICRSDEDCGPGEVCEDLCPGCLGGPIGCPCSGVCLPDPCICPDVWAPVCGVDGTLYDNACEARCAGVEVGDPGRCLIEVCSVFCELDCPNGFVVGPDGCPTCECKPDPCICPRVYAPVCGVDGNTYGNACEARCAGVEIAHEGECRSGCSSNADCQGDLICFPPTDTCRPECRIDCIVYDPVCGTDGVTYGCGELDAFCHGAEVAHDGECRCYGSQDCPDGTRCNAAEVCLPPPGCEPGTACPAVCTGMCVPDPA